MSRSLHHYYERELTFIRKDAEDFARKYPNTASRLLLEKTRAVDPHVERLIEAFALLAGRVEHKLDDEFPELTDALLGVLYPHYLAPIPSMAIVQFELDPGRAPYLLLERGSRLHTQPIEYRREQRIAVQFRTCYPVRLWPLAVTAAQLSGPPFPPGVRPPPRTAAALRIQFECRGESTFSSLDMDRVRLYLHGTNKASIAALYEVLFNQDKESQVVFRSLDPGSTAPPVMLPPGRCLFPVGFERAEGLLPYPNQSFVGYRLLTEFFTFPHKFLFVDVAGWDEVRRAGFKKQLEMIVFVKKTDKTLEQEVDKNTFQLGCTPIVNLFPQTAEPINLTQARYEYRVVPDVHHPYGMEVYSIDSVTHSDPSTGTTKEYHPFYSFRHGSERDRHDAFWYPSRRASLEENDRGTDVYLNLVDLGFNPHLPAESVLVPKTTCTNRDVASKLQHVGDELYLELEAAAPLARSIRVLRAPTMPLRPAWGRGAYWRLISQLSLNHLSITPQVDRIDRLSKDERAQLFREGREALQEILRLYDFSDPESGQELALVTRQLIDGILSVGFRRVVRRTGGPASGFGRGIEVEVEFDEEKYVGTGVYLFASVLERFLGLYASINSFSQLVAKTKQGEGHLKQWPPRAGELQLL
jgi:type VI secretion system protein ImpG